MAGMRWNPTSSTWTFTWGARSKRAAGSCCTARTILPPTPRLPIDDGVSLTATVDILKAIAGGKGPDRAILALGYAGWRPGQLESEIQANGWLHCPPDLDLLFDRDLDQKYHRAMSKIGIDPSHLVSEAGHA